jgi:hypothetical protein
MRKDTKTTHKLRRSSRFALLVILMASLPVFSSQAQDDRLPAENTRTQELVDQLKEVIQKAERDRRSDPTTIQRLRDLVRRYDWPWKVSLLHDDFRDGNYTVNPSWVVSHGDFWVARGTGLRSAYSPEPERVRHTSDRRPENPAIGILGEILWGKREADAPVSDKASPPAEIYTRVAITDAFALKLQLTSDGFRDSGGGRLEFGPFRGQERSGYRLAYEPGKNSAISLLRISPGRSSVIDFYDQGVDLEDGKSHTLEWRRDAGGEMVVLLDQKEIIRTVDRAFGEPYDGFAIINTGGDYAIKQIAISGADR